MQFLKFLKKIFLSEKQNVKILSNEGGGSGVWLSLSEPGARGKITALDLVFIYLDD